MASQNIAVILPCYNEEAAIYSVVSAFKAVLPEALVYVFDNNSIDQTIAEAKRAGAIVRSERRKGKGAVVRRMFADVEADIYVMADGDGTYDAQLAPSLIAALAQDNLDMVVGARVPEAGQATYRRGHRFGNQFLTKSVSLIFGYGFTDMLSGYRVFSRRFVKSFPALSTGFEIETELTIHALSLSLPCGEVNTPYYERTEGSVSKLNTYRDGANIMLFIMLFFKEIKPFAFFTVLAAFIALLSLILGIPVILDYFETGLVERFPTALLSAAVMLVAVIAFVCGVILDSVSRGRRENKRFAYLAAAQRRI